MGYDNTNRGALFVNNKKQNDKHPDMNGKIDINGVEHWFSGWWKRPNSGGDEFLSISIGAAVETADKPKQDTSTRGKPRQQREDQKYAPAADDFQDADIPF